MKVSLFLFLFISFASFAQVVDDIDTQEGTSAKKELSEITKSKLLLELKTFTKLPLETVEGEIQKYNDDVLFYVQQRDKECKGEFSSIELDENGESEVVKRKLSKSERKLCLMELVNFRKNYINEIFKIRKKILIKDHNQQVKDLEAIRKESIQKMDELSKKLSK